MLPIAIKSKDKISAVDFLYAKADPDQGRSLVVFSSRSYSKFGTTNLIGRIFLYEKRTALKISEYGCVGDDYFQPKEDYTKLGGLSIRCITS